MRPPSINTERHARRWWAESLHDLTKPALKRFQNSTRLRRSPALISDNDFDATFRSDHGRVEERSLAMHQLMAQKVLADPVLLEMARENLRRWQQMLGSPAPVLSEWETILSGPVDQVTKILVERSERAARLRPVPSPAFSLKLSAEPSMNAIQMEPRCLASIK